MRTNQVIAYEGTINEGKYKGQTVICYSISGLFSILREKESKIEINLSSTQTPTKQGDQTQ